MIRLALRIIVIGAVIFGLGGYCARAFAQVAEPSVVELVSATAYYDALGRGDSSVAALVLYHIEYDEGTAPAQDIDELLAIRLAAASGPLAVSQPYPYANGGYGYGVVGFLLPDPSGVTTASSLTASVMYFPGYVSGAHDHEVSVEWRPRADFEADVVQALRRVEADTGGVLELLNDGDNLTAAGGVYAAGSIPYLRALAPGLYSQSLTEIDINRQEVGEAYAEELQDTGGGERWRTQFNSTADWLGQPVVMVSTFVTLIVGAIAAWFGSKLAKSPLVTLPIMTITLAGGAIVGWVHLGFIAIIGFFALLIFAFVVILKRAT